jgi:hypothetical protein
VKIPGLWAGKPYKPDGSDLYSPSMFSNIWLYVEIVPEIKLLKPLEKILEFSFSVNVAIAWDPNRDGSIFSAIADSVGNVQKYNIQTSIYKHVQMYTLNNCNWIYDRGREIERFISFHQMFNHIHLFLFLFLFLFVWILLTMNNE